MAHFLRLSHIEFISGPEGFVLAGALSREIDEFGE
jgi:hypothetical protein